MRQQQPLALKRGNQSHDYRQNQDNWEAAIFDNATYFFVLRLLSEPRRKRDEFPTARAAIAFARQYPEEGTCVYAIVATGGCVVLDKIAWDGWIQREEGTT